MDSECQTRMAHSNYGQKEQHAPPHTGLEVKDQLQDARAECYRPFQNSGLVSKKKITISWTGTALILIVPCIGGPGDIPQSRICITVLATKKCRDNWLYHAHTLYIHAHTLYRHEHTYACTTK